MEVEQYLTLLKINMIVLWRYLLNYKNQKEVELIFLLRSAKIYQIYKMKIKVGRLMETQEVMEILEVTIKDVGVIKLETADLAETVDLKMTIVAVTETEVLDRVEMGIMGTLKIEIIKTKVDQETVAVQMGGAQIQAGDN